MTMYRVWDPLNQAEDEAIEREFEYGALHVDAAAELHASYRFTPDEGSARSWPLTYQVRNLDTGKLFDVSVALDWEPSFSAGAPVEVGGDPAPKRRARLRRRR